jgi:hypothetical protein
VNPQLNLHPNMVLCAGCMQETSKAFSRTGKVFVGVGFKEIGPVEEMEFDAESGQVTLHVREVKKIPIDQWRTGFICPDCASDYQTVTRRDGSWFPRVKLDKTPTEHDTINPGWSREDRSPAQQTPNFPYNNEVWINANTYLINPDAPEEPLHVGGYLKFGKGR